MKQVEVSHSVMNTSCANFSAGLFLLWPESIFTTETLHPDTERGANQFTSPLLKALVDLSSLVQVFDARRKP